jgi:hypothetical protein
MAITSVQILGADNVLRAYEHVGFAKWAIFQGKSLNRFYNGDDITEGAEELRNWLSIISGYTKAIYTLKLYNDSVSEIRVSTEENASFNFRLYDDEVTGFESARVRAVSVTASESVNPKVLELLEKMDARLTAMEEKAISGAGEPELSVIERVLDSPLTMAVVGKLLNISSKDLPPVASVGSVPGSLDDTLDILRNYDPDLELHLAKLAKIAINNPAQFKMLLGMLENF